MSSNCYDNVSGRLKTFLYLLKSLLKSMCSKGNDWTDDQTLFLSSSLNELVDIKVLSYVTDQNSLIFREHFHVGPLMLTRRNLVPNEMKFPIFIILIAFISVQSC